MKKLSFIALFALVVLGSTRPAEATLFTLNSYTVTVQAAEPGLVLWTQELMAEPTSFELNTVNQSYTAQLFRVGTTETSAQWDDYQERSINVAFSFTAPPPAFGGTAQGVSGAAWFFGNYGYVDWNGPVTLSFGQTGRLEVRLSDATFGMPGAANVSATFTLRQADTPAPPAQVPEPSSLLLMGAGTLGVIRRWRRRAA